MNNCHLTLLLQVRSAGEEAWLGGPAPVDPLLDPVPNPTLSLQQKHTHLPETISATGLELAAHVPNAGRNALCHHICNTCAYGSHMGPMNASSSINVDSYGVWHLLDLEMMNA